jgi:hypothetical protein
MYSYVVKQGDMQWVKIRDVKPIVTKLQQPETAIPHNVVFGKDFFSDNANPRIGNIYFYIPVSRLIYMTIFTFGLYQMYWFYKQWFYWAHQHKQIHRSVDRELSWWFFPWMIFEKIETDKELNAVERANFNGGQLFWAWVFCGGFLSLLQMTISSYNIWYFVLTIVGGILDVYFILPIQNYINRVNGKLGNRYDPPGIGHYLCVIAGFVLILSYLSFSKIWVLFQTAF